MNFILLGIGMAIIIIGFLLMSGAGYIHSPDHSTKGTRSLFDELSVLVNTRFQVLFHSPSGVLFTFPSQYFFTIGHRVVFRLGSLSMVETRLFFCSAIPIRIVPG